MITMQKCTQCGSRWTGELHIETIKNEVCYVCPFCGNPTIKVVDHYFENPDKKLWVVI